MDVKIINELAKVIQKYMQLKIHYPKYFQFYFLFSAIIVKERKCQEK